MVYRLLSKNIGMQFLWVGMAPYMVTDCKTNHQLVDLAMLNFFTMHNSISQLRIIILIQQPKLYKAHEIHLTITKYNLNS